TRIEKSTQCIRVTEWKAWTFVQFLGCGVECNGFIPEHAQHLHPFRVVPHVCTDHAARPHDSAQLADCTRGIGDEVEHETAHGSVSLIVSERQRLSICTRERAAPVRQRCRGCTHESRGPVERENAPRFSALQDRTAQRTRAAADIQPVDSRRQAQPVQVTLRNRPAPAPDVRFVSKSYIPNVHCLCASMRPKRNRGAHHRSSAVKQHAVGRFRYFSRMRARCTPCASRMDMYTILPLPKPTIE